MDRSWASIDCSQHCQLIDGTSLLGSSRVSFPNTHSIHILSRGGKYLVTSRVLLSTMEGLRDKPTTRQQAKKQKKKRKLKAAGAGFMGLAGVGLTEEDQLLSLMDEMSAHIKVRVSLTT